MADDIISLELRSEVRDDGTLHLSLAEVTIAGPGPDEVVVRIEAAPVNPSDLGLLTGPADLKTIRAGGTADRPTLTADIPPQRMGGVAARIGQSLPVGNEGAGTVVRVGANAAGLMGRTVAVLGGAMYAQYLRVPASACLPLPEGASARDGASAFVNPLTALAMVEVMRAEGHTALVHTAAASNLGQMLNRICIADGVALVNIVRSSAQATILRDIGARHIVDSSTADFGDALTGALAETGATLAFDAVGGPLPGQILAAMERAAGRSAAEYSRYGSTMHKQVYAYGVLDLKPIQIERNLGMAWGVGGWLLTPFLQKAGGEVRQRMRARVAAELRTTFASHYTAEISLAEALSPEMLAAYARRATGEKYLINPNKAVA